MQDAAGVLLDVQKQRKPGGKFTLVDLDILAGLKFPVEIDPEIGGADRCVAHGTDGANYLNARGTADSFSNAASWWRNGQYQSAGGTYLVGRFAISWSAIAYTGTILTAEVNLACYQDLDGRTADDTYVFKRCDWGAWRPCGFFTSENAFDCVRTSVLGASLSTLNHLDGVHKCYRDNANVWDWGDWETLNAGDITHLNANDGLGGRLYGGVMTSHDQTATAPGVGVYEEVLLYARLNLKFTAAAGGFIWVIG